MMKISNDVVVVIMLMVKVTLGKVVLLYSTFSMLKGALQ